MKAQGFFLALASVALGAMTVVGCSSESDPKGGGGEGGGIPTTQPPGTGGNGGETPTTVGSSSSGGVDASTRVGASCGRDSDCGNGGRCHTSTDLDSPFGGAIPGGYCTLDCETDDDCGEFAGCAPLTTEANSPKVCIALCKMNTDYVNGATFALDPNKCHGRVDQACYEGVADGAVATGVGVCQPVCNIGGCDGALECDPGSGRCVEADKAPQGTLPFGRKCNPKDTEDACAGFCIAASSADETLGFCTGVCAIGANYDTQCGGLAGGFCAYGTWDYPEGEFNAVQDLGFCAGGCNAQDECAAPATYCIDLGAANGFCVNTDPCETDEQCALPAGSTLPKQYCIETKDGGRCLSGALVDGVAVSKYPLGSLAPEQGGTGGAGGSGAGGSGGAGGSTP